MTLPIMISLYFRIETTASRRLFHYHIYVLLPWIKLIHWQQNGLLISIEGNIRVIYFKPIQIIGWWNDKQSFINWNICIMEIITNIQYPCSNYIHRCYKSFDPELISMWYWNIRLIKINDLDMRTSICRALCKKIPCIITVTFLDTWINEIIEDLCSIREWLDQYGIRKKVKSFVLITFYK